MLSNPSEPILRLEAFPAGPAKCLALRFGQPATLHTVFDRRRSPEKWERQLRPYPDRLTTTATSDWRPEQLLSDRVLARAPQSARGFIAGGSAA